MSKVFLTIILLASLFSKCQKEEQLADAYGNFEAVETIVSAQANGQLISLHVEEGEKLKAGELVAIVDTTQLHLQKLQVQATAGTIAQKVRSATPRIEVLKEQLANLEREAKRVAALLKAKAATPKQMDDLNGQIKVVKRQIVAAKEEVDIANKAILSQKTPLVAQIPLIEEQIRKCYVRNPVSGTVLTKLVEPNEVVHFGSPLYKIADLNYLSLRAYVSGEQLSEIKIGQEVNVLIDAIDPNKRQHKGEIYWIASKAEFTPRTIQTKSERVNLVYAVKIKVKNNGLLKIGMPGEVWLGDPPREEEKEGSTQSK